MSANKSKTLGSMAKHLKSHGIHADNAPARRELLSQLAVEPTSTEEEEEWATNFLKFTEIAQAAEEKEEEDVARFGRFDEEIERLTKELEAYKLQSAEERKQCELKEQELHRLFKEDLQNAQNAWEQEIARVRKEQEDKFADPFEPQKFNDELNM